jgi:hypothetical protein
MRSALSDIRLEDLHCARINVAEGSKIRIGRCDSEYGATDIIRQ